MKTRLSGSFRRYRVSFGARRPEVEALQKKLFAHRFKSIDDARSVLRAVGWTDSDGLLPARPQDWELALGPFLAFGLRIDERRIPAGALRVRVLEAVRAEQFSVRSDLAPARRQEIREGIEEELLARALPGTQVQQVLLDLQGGVLLYSSTSEPANAALISLFRDTFEVGLEAMTPAKVPSTFSAPERWTKRLETALPARYV